MSWASRLGPLGRTLRIRDLRLLLLAGLVSQTGDWILATGIAFQVYALTGSALASAIALLVTQAPQVLVGSIAGVVADRVDRRRLMIAINLALAVVLIPLLLVRGAGDIAIVYVVVAVTSCLSPFFAAAEVALLPELVDEEHLVTANALNGQARNVARLVGAAVGGVVVATGGVLWLALADIATFVVAAGLLWRIRHRAIRPEGAAGRPLRDWIEGLAVIPRSRVLIVLLVFFALSGVGEATMGALFAPFVADVLGGTGEAFGAIVSAQAVGGIVGGAVVAAFAHRIPPRTLFGVGALLFGLGDAVLFLYPLVAPTPWPAAVIIALVGLPGAALSAGMLTLLQTSADDRMRARVFGALITVQNAAMLASTLLAGVLADALGIVPVITAQAVAYTVVGLLAVVALRGTGRSHPDDRPVVDPGDLLDNPTLTTMLPTMPLSSNVRLRTISDPVAMRALAHPLRVELHGLVAREGTLTAADAARQLGISHALASHHLRQLAKYGFIEPAEAGDQRARPWRITATDTELERDEPDARAAADVLDRFRAEQAVVELADWQGRRDSEDPGWVENTGVRSSLLYLTPDELDELMRGWIDLVIPRARARPVGHPENRPADALPVSFTLVAAPLTPTESGG